MPSRTRYPTDLKDEEYAVIKDLIPPPKPGGRPVKYERREGGFGEAERVGPSVASGVVGRVQIPKSPKGEASGKVVAVGSRRAKRTL
jgi:transposase